MIRDVGLVVGVFEILSVNGGVVPIGRGMSEVDVVANLLVFQPLVGEIITGALLSCDEHKGINRRLPPPFPPFLLAFLPFS